MASKFGILAKFTFLQDIVSLYIARLNPAITHNIEKYHAIKKAHYLTAIEGMSGDYLEFGVFTGSSFCHSLRCGESMAYLNDHNSQMRYYGFDSFSGFGDLAEDDEHPFYTDLNFDTDFDQVNARIKRTASGKHFELIPGYFEEVLKDGPDKYGISEARIVFVDSDTFSSASCCLDFCGPIIQTGTILILDDFFSYKGNLNKGVAGAFAKFQDDWNISSRKILTYGMGGAVFVLGRRT